MFFCVVLQILIYCLMQSPHCPQLILWFLVIPTKLLCPLLPLERLRVLNRSICLHYFPEHFILSVYVFFTSLQKNILTLLNVLMAVHNFIDYLLSYHLLISKVIVHPILHSMPTSCLQKPCIRLRQCKCLQMLVPIAQVFANVCRFRNFAYGTFLLFLSHL